jgi:hypothetical protein
MPLASPRVNPSRAAPLLGAFADGHACVIAGGRTGGRVALAWLERGDGRVTRVTVL